MDLEPKQFFSLLYEHCEDDKSGAKDCNQLLSNFNEVLTQEQVNLADLDSYLQHMFNKSHGLLLFVEKIVNKRPLKSSMIKVFEIIYTLINTFPSKLERYIVTVCDICFKVIKSSLVSSDEKVKSLEVLTLSFEKIDKSLENADYYTDIYNSLFKSISIKKCDTVQEKILKALGAFAKHFQYLVTNQEGLRTVFLSGLELQMIQKEFSNRIVCGSFAGLEQFCESFPLDSNIEEDVVIINKIYKYLEKIAIPTSSVKIANRAALTFLANNISIFVSLMIEKFQYWHETLLKWLSFGAEDQKVGVLVIEAFYRGIGDFLFKDENRESSKHITMYFYEYFKRNLRSQTNSSRTKRMCLYGLSSFSAIYHLHLKDEEMKDLLILIVQNFEEMYVLNQDPSSDVLEYLPFYLQTVAKFVHFKTITNCELFCLQKGAVVMIKVFPQLPYSCHNAVVEALVSTFHFLSSNNEQIFDNFVETVIYQGVVWSCSHQHISEVEISQEDSQKVITIRNYLHIWKGLLQILSLRKYDKYKIFLRDRKYILVKVIDKLMRTMLILINKLNVEIELNDNTVGLTDIQSAYKVTEVNDFAIFLNVVDFYQVIFEEADPNILQKCICKLIPHLITKCTKYPLISGFYKLLSFCLKICNKIKYFEESNIITAQDVDRCYLTLTKFVDILLNKTLIFKGDLLIACLQVLLEYPVVIIRKILPSCVSSFRTIFYLGRTYVKLADLALDTLEYWQTEITYEEIEPFLLQVIPLLDCYLQSKSLGTFSHTNITQSRRKTSKALKKRKILVDIEPELLKLQMRILKFVGQQRSTLCQAVAFSEDDVNLAVWGSQQHLKLVLPYEDIKLEIHLDRLLPQIINVALTSTDRKTKIVACELLQAILMIFLGTTKQMSHSGLSDLNELLKYVSIPLLKLGCDMDQLVEQLFRPLCFQLIHWYTHCSQSRLEHSAIIIEAVLEGITHPTDTALRDFAGKCVNEFIKWTIKQTSQNNLARDPIHIKILLKKMRFYSMHPDQFKKLGAALIFNNVYREIREETSILSMFWIEFLHVFVRSLSTYEDEMTDDNIIVQINSALTHIERGFVEKSSLFNKNDKDRKIPIDIKGGLLEDVSVWLLEQTGSKSRYCRVKSMHLFYNITCYTEGYTSLQDFIINNFKKEGWVQEIYESYLNQYPTVECMCECEGATPIKWMQAFLCALDGYHFVIKNRLVPVEDNILSETVKTSIYYFIGKISTLTLAGAFAMIQEKTWMFTTFQKQTFDKQKTQAILKILQLFNLLEHHIFSLCTSDLWNFIVNIFFNRQTLGFDYFLPHSGDYNEIVQLTRDFLKNLPEDKADELLNVINGYIINHFVSDFDLKSHVSHKQRNLMEGIITLQSFALNQLNLHNFCKGMVAMVIKKFIHFAENDVLYMDDLQDTTLTYCLTVFDFALDNEDEFKTFISFLYEPYKVQTSDNKQPIHFGIYLLSVFKDSVMQKIINNFELFLNLSLEQYKTINVTTELIFHTLSYTTSNKQFRGANEVAIKNLLMKWDIFEKYFNEDAAKIEFGLNFVKCLLPIMKLHKISNKSLKDWLSRLLMYDKNVTWKNELDMQAEVFYLLVSIVETSEDDDVNVRDGLQHMKNKLFLDASPIPLDAKMIFLNKLLGATSKIRSPELLIFLLNIYAKFETKNCKIDLKSLLTDFILNSHQFHENLLFKVHDLYSDEDLDSFQKYKLVISTAPIFQYSNIAAFEEFFVENIFKLISVLKEPTNETNMIDKIIQFVLVEMLFLRCPVHSGDTEIGRITQAALPQKANNKTFVLQLLKFTLDTVKDSLECSGDFSELFRLYKCHSYNAMISIISNSMKDMNFYTKLIVRQENNNDILWKGLIDTNKTYVFQGDFDNIPKQKKILINIRDEVRARKKLQSSQFQSAKYIESMRIYNSSLSEDVTKFDFTNNIIRSQVEEEEEVDNKINIQSEIELDCTDINFHECMPNVCGLIEHMVKTGITELPTDEDEDYELPAWVDGVRNLLLNAQTHDNVKIFWVKVIDNSMHIFKHFAKWFLEPLLKFIVDKCAGTINYFVTDVVAILSAWSTEIIPTSESEIQLASELLIFIIDNLNNERQDMFKYHLELIRVLVEAWKSSVTVPHDLVYSKINVDPTSRKVEIGIHLSSILLANKVAPWKDNNIEFCKTLFTIIMKSKHKSTYKPCAETIGLVLLFTSKEQTFSKFFGNVHVLLKKISDSDKYANVLEAVVLHYPEIADEFHLNILLSRLHGIPKLLKVIYLRIILKRSHVMSKIDDFKTERWDTYVENDDFEVQLLALEIVHKCLEILKDCPLFKPIIESVCKHVTNSNVLCKTRMFDIIILLSQKKYSSNEILNICKKVLVQGLADEDTEIREKVYTFWRNNNLPTQISSRFSYILSNLYETNTENYFLGYSSYLLLDSIKTTEEYSNMLFDHPLEDCDFEDYNLQANWRVRHLSAVPLFAETVRSSSEDYELFESDANKLRQTQKSFEFAPTQSLRLKQFSEYAMSQSSLFIKSEDKTFVDPNLVHISHKYRVPKRRFLRDKSKIHSYFAHQEVKKAVQKIEQRKDLAKERENKVTIYRSYRHGDLPDIQITLQAILDPLQAFALHDGEVSKILYSEMFKTVLCKMRNDFIFMNELSSGIKIIFKNSIQFNRNLFRTLLDALLLSKNVITFSPDLIVTICQFSGLRTLGILILEEYLISHEETASDSKKKRGFPTSSEKFWTKLAELYKEIDEWDAVKSIFLEKTECSDIVKDALIAESRKQWKDAQDLYKGLLETDESLERKDFYYESYFKCFAHLGEWTNLVESIDSIVSHSGSNSWNALWDQSFNQQKLMPWYIGAQLKNALFTQNRSNQFFSDLNTSLNSEHMGYLQNHFSEEIAMLWIFENEIEEAEQYLRIYLNNFLDYWQQLDSSYANLRYKKLLKLRNIIDISKFVEVFNSLDIESKTQIKDLLNYWDRTTHEDVPSILFCEERVLYRRQFIHLLENKIKSYSEEELDSLVTELDNLKLTLNDGLMDASIKQNNFYMSKKYLTGYNSNSAKHRLILCKLAQIKSTMLNCSTRQVDVLLQGCKTLAPVFQESEQTFANMMAHIYFFNQLDHITSILLNDDDLFCNKKAEVMNITEAIKIASVEDIALFGADKLKLFLQAYENNLDNKMETEVGNTHMKECATIASAYVELAYFSRRQGKQLFSDFMLFVLRAMKFNSSEGRQLFPCIIMETEFNDQNQNQFIEETEKISVWMFLGWIPQILVNVDSPKLPAVAPLILKIARAYPQAVMYAYKLSKENYKCVNTEAQHLIQKLDDLLLNNDGIDKFLKGLSFIGIPASILLYYIKKITKLFQSSDFAQLKVVQEHILNDLFNCKPNSRDITVMQGDMYKGIRKFEKEIKSIDRCNTRNTEMLKLFKKIEEELFNILRSSNEVKRYSKLLNDYCPWLANFSAHKMNLDLEIPGQYDGKKMPLLQHHVKISAFVPNVSVMSSLRKPIKITILGNNTKEYPFLVKFGEDVRQDQRIQQLFSLMNNIFDHDKDLNGREFSILTYQVVPLTTNLGIIQWIDNTNSLQEFAKKSVKNKNSFEEISETYCKWIYKSKQLSVLDAYGRAAMNYSRDKTIPKFRSLASMLEWDILRLTFLKLSANTEGYFALRNNFIKSYAIMSVSHWILGVGDRHLSNSLICLKNGKVLGIDFGHAFGTATQILPVPELVPFRLTPHLISLMEPLGERGLFKEIMVHCLRSLRSNTGSLLATMNVFVEEPSLDWLEHASRFYEKSAASTHEWYPAQKIDQAKRKLLGAKSTSIMVEDLRAGHQKNEMYMKTYIQLVEGSPEFDLRARKEGDNLSVEDQVDCLIDHATDYNLLGRMFEGWTAWV